MKIKNLTLLTLITAILVFSVLIQNVFAVSATLYGEVTDDGGDPNLYVWFQYGRTTSYGYETSRQTKYGSGEFSATVSGLDTCTTYHYRAVVKHQNYDDTRYGEDKTFVTPCQVNLNLKANDLDGPISISYRERTITLSWISQYADTCTAETTNKPSGSSINWSGTKSTSGSESVTLDRAGSYIFKLTCKNNATENTSYDTVQVNLRQPALDVITKGVVITY
jgi:hypothetical protein